MTIFIHCRAHLPFWLSFKSTKNDTCAHTQHTRSTYLLPNCGMVHSHTQTTYVKHTGFIIQIMMIAERASKRAIERAQMMYMISNIVNRGNHTMALDFDACCACFFHSFSRVRSLSSSHFCLCWLSFDAVSTHTHRHISMGQPPSCSVCFVYFYHVWHSYFQT